MIIFIFIIFGIPFSIVYIRFPMLSICPFHFEKHRQASAFRYINALVIILYHCIHSPIDLFFHSIEKLFPLTFIGLF